jgi:hypothetical protein
MGGKQSRVCRKCRPRDHPECEPLQLIGCPICQKHKITRKTEIVIPLSLVDEARARYDKKYKSRGYGDVSAIFPAEFGWSFECYYCESCFNIKGKREGVIRKKDGFVLSHFKE